MKEIALRSLKIGMCISSDIFNDLGNIILAKGTEITDRHLDYFTSHNIDHMFVEDQFGNLYESVSPRIEADDKFRNINAHYAQVLNQFKQIYFQAQNADALQVNIDLVEKELEPLIDELLHDNDILGSLRLVSFRESYHFTHAVNVCMLGAMLGKWLNLDRNTIQSIALAGLLHDIGKTQILDALLNKVGPLTLEEKEILKTHSKLGYEMLKSNPEISKDVLAAILFHHERSDGSGYPSGIKEDQTPYLARIIGVVDVFDAVTSDRVYKTGISTFQAFSVLKDESFKGLDPAISEVFLSNIASHFINNRVRLSNGESGEVVYVNRYALNRPLVKLNNGRFVDLSTDYSLDIDTVIK
ncbi:HD-GYP domain-containing protein [Fusibacter tunisiensis]|uniref:HD-GYP domain-containing protein (C-di-GMP phosphodiesterase class II) n=1 Tax=Fusibacter tunisiensis TaxID=1008308 RepID=A0ABS2MQJ3_9FIRM|nr:HD-GYP domain-containing protein [Fusibacter tunisiensis]MBM7561670.1 HD-GYP domain-containing protein (c-di-GMP phosphodiesterase class II) [Fusibacter tunisiensis]